MKINIHRFGPRKYAVECEKTFHGRNNNEGDQFHTSASSASKSLETYGFGPHTELDMAATEGKKSKIVKTHREVNGRITEEEKMEESDNIESLDETAAAASLTPGSSPVGPANKAWAFGKIVNAIPGMDQETINKFVAMIDQIGHEADSIPGSDASKNKASVDTKPSGAAVQLVTRLEAVDDVMRSVIKEDISTLFEGDDLSEEFKTKIETIIESAINLKVGAKVIELEEAYEEQLSEEVEEIAKDLIGTLEVAIDSIAETWLENNEVAIVSTLRSDLTEQFLEDLHGLFATHYIDIPEDKVDIVEEQALRIEELEEIASEVLEENLSLKRTIEEATAEFEVAEALDSVTEGMVATDAEKLRELAESVEFTSATDFTKKLGVLKEAHFTTVKKPTASVLFEETEILDEEVSSEKKLTGSMAQYVKAIERGNR